MCESLTERQADRQDWEPIQLPGGEGSLLCAPFPGGLLAGVPLAQPPEPLSLLTHPKAPLILGRGPGPLSAHPQLPSLAIRVTFPRTWYPLPHSESRPTSLWAREPLHSAMLGWQGREQVPQRSMLKPPPLDPGVLAHCLSARPRAASSLLRTEVSSPFGDSQAAEKRHRGEHC